MLRGVRFAWASEPEFPCAERTGRGDENTKKPIRIRAATHESAFADCGPHWRVYAARWSAPMTHACAVPPASMPRGGTREGGFCVKPGFQPCRQPCFADCGPGSARLRPPGDPTMRTRAPSPPLASRAGEPAKAGFVSFKPGFQPGASNPVPSPGAFNPVPRRAPRPPARTQPRPCRSTVVGRGADPLARPLLAPSRVPATSRDARPPGSETVSAPDNTGRAPRRQAPRGESPAPPTACSSTAASPSATPRRSFPTCASWGSATCTRRPTCRRGRGACTATTSPTTPR